MWRLLNGGCCCLLLVKTLQPQIFCTVDSAINTPLLAQCPCTKCSVTTKRWFLLWLNFGVLIVQQHRALQNSTFCCTLLLDNDMKKPVPSVTGNATYFPVSIGSCKYGRWFDWQWIEAVAWAVSGWAINIYWESLADQIQPVNSYRVRKKVFASRVQNSSLSNIQRFSNVTVKMSLKLTFDGTSLQ